MTDVTKNFTPQFLFLDQKIVVKFVFFLLRGVRSADADEMCKIWSENYIVHKIYCIILYERLKTLQLCKVQCMISPQPQSNTLSIDVSR
jgi:hypothetical protein